jgi:hypothetical protein
LTEDLVEVLSGVIVVGLVLTAVDMVIVKMQILMFSRTSNSTVSNWFSCYWNCSNGSDRNSSV